MQRSAIAFALLLTLPLSLAHAEEGAPADLAAKLEQLQQRIDALEKENAELRQQLGLAEQQKQTLAQEKQALVEEKEDLAAEREQLEKLAGVTSKGEQVESAVALVETSYNADKDRTRVVFKPRRINTTGSGPFSAEHYLGVAYGYAGQSMQSPPESVDLQVYTFLHPTNAYKGVTEADVVVDGQESLTIPLASYEVLKTRKSPPSLRRGEDRYDELLRFSLDAETLRKLATAHEVIIKLPGNDLALTREHIAMLAGARQRISQGI